MHKSFEINHESLDGYQDKGATKREPDNRVFQPNKNEHPGALAGATGAEFDEADNANTTTSARPKSRQDRWRERNPLAYWAHAATRSALRRGLIQRQPCAVCGAEKAEAHHPDYGDPLHPQWLCRRHHKALHASQRRAAE